MFKVVVFSGRESKGYAEDIGEFGDEFLEDEQKCEDVNTIDNEGSTMLFVEELEVLSAFGITDVEEV